MVGDVPGDRDGWEKLGKTVSKVHSGSSDRGCGTEWRLWQWKWKGKMRISSDQLVAVGNSAHECDQLTFTCHSREQGICKRDWWGMLRTEREESTFQIPEWQMEKSFKEEEDNVTWRIDINLDK